MTATATFSWGTNGSGTWNTGSYWSGGTAPAITGTATNGILDVFGTGAGSAYTVTLGATTVSAGAVSVTSGNATIQITSGQTLQSLALAGQGGASAAGGSLTMSAGTVQLDSTTSTATLKFWTYSIGSGAQITGFGTITAPASNMASPNNSKITTTGTGKVVASTSGKTLDILGNGGSNNQMTLAGTNFEIDSGATLKFDSNVILSSSSYSNVDFTNAVDTLTVLDNTSEFQSSSVLGTTYYTLNANLNNLHVGSSGAYTGSSAIYVSGLTSAVSSTFLSTSTNFDVVTTGVTYVFDTNVTLTGKSIHTTYDGVAGTYIWVDTQVCYAGGTRIQTDRGEVLVEDIAEGDLVVTLDGDQQILKPVKWVGHRRLDLTTHRNPTQAAPIRFRRGALGENLPHRDLVVSPDHGMLVDGKLIPAKLLINGMTITQERQARSVTYYHVELEQHAMLLAEGVAAESYLDTGNRAFFSNAGLALVLHPEFTINENLKCWQEDACMPLTVAATAVEPVWRALAERAESLGYAAPERATTSDADLHLVVDGKRLRPVASDDTRHVFMVPAGASDIRLASRASSPWEKTPYLDDPRRLGVAVSRIIVRSDDDYIDVPADHPALSQGWHKPEQAGQSIWRWTDGNAALPITGESRALMVEVHVSGSNVYLLPQAETEQRLVA